MVHIRINSFYVWYSNKYSYIPLAMVSMVPVFYLVCDRLGASHEGSSKTYTSTVREKVTPLATHPPSSTAPLQAGSSLGRGFMMLERLLFSSESRWHGHDFRRTTKLSSSDAWELGAFGVPGGVARVPSSCSNRREGSMESMEDRREGSMEESVEDVLNIPFSSICSPGAEGSGSRRLATRFIHLTRGDDPSRSSLVVDVALDGEV